MYGPRVQLDLQFSNFNDNDKLKDILKLYQDHIVSLANIKYPGTLLGLDFTNITKLDIDFCNVNDHNVCEAILDRYGDKLEHLGVKNLDYLVRDNSTLRVYPLSKLKSLTLCSVKFNLIQCIMDAVNKEIITHLSLDFNGRNWSHITRKDVIKCNFGKIVFPKLKHLTVSYTLNGVFQNTPEFWPNIGMSALIMPNLNSLELVNISWVEATSLIQCNRFIKKLVMKNVQGYRDRTSDRKLGFA